MKKRLIAALLAVLLMIPTFTVANAEAAFAITQQPRDIEAPLGSTGFARVAAAGEGEISYRWYWWDAVDEEWIDTGVTDGEGRLVREWEGFDTDTLFVPVTESSVGQMFYCLLTDENGNTLESEVVTVREGLTSEISIETQPTDIYAANGETGTAYVAVSVESEPLIEISEEPEPQEIRIERETELSYRWLYWDAASDTWQAAVYADGDTDTVRIPVTEENNGQQLMCLIRTADGGSVETNVITVHMTETAEPEGPIELEEPEPSEEPEEPEEPEPAETPAPSEITIVTQPTDIKAPLGETGTATVEAISDVPLHYRWYFKAKGSNRWSPSEFTGCNTDTISVPVTATRIGQQYKCVIITNDGGRVETDAVTVLEREPSEIKIKTQPTDIQARLGQSGTATVEAVSDAPLSYRWYFKAKNSNTWQASGFPGCETNTISVPVETQRVGQQYKCVITTNDGGRVETNAVTVLAPIPSEISIVSQPTDIQARLGQSGTATVEAVSDVPLSYRWYFKAKGSSSWSLSGFPGCDTNTISVPVEIQRVGQQYKCVITTNDGGRVETNAVTVLAPIPSEISIVSQPTDIQAKLGQSGTATVEAVSEAPLRYRWYFKAKNSDSWQTSGFPGCETNTISVPVETQRVGQQYKCVITTNDGGRVETNAVTVLAPIPSEISIVSQPTDIQARLGQSGTATVEAVSEAPLRYRWYFKAKNSNTWQASGFPGCETNTISVPVETQRVGQQYKCVITTNDGGRVETNAVTVLAPIPSVITIETQPTDMFASLGNDSTATVKAFADTGAALSYQWYFKTRGSDVWQLSGMSGCKTATITVPVTEARIGQQYKCVITTKDGGRAETDAVTIKDNSAYAFAVTRNPDSYRAYAGDPVELDVSTSSDATLRYQWYKDGEEIVGATDNRLYFSAVAPENAGEYYCVVSGYGYNEVSKTATVSVLGA